MIPIYVIYQSAHMERIDSLMLRAKGVGLTVTPFEGMNGKQANVVATFESGQPMSKGHTGCCISHWFMWQHVKRMNHEWVVVLEDDAVINERFEEQVIRANSQAVEHNMQLVYLGWTRPGNSNAFPLVLTPVTTNLARGNGTPFGTHAMLIHREAIELMIEKNRRILCHIDLQLGKTTLPHLKWGLCTPSIIHQGNWPSTTRNP